jgi:hypothetical protein
MERSEHIAEQATRRRTGIGINVAAQVVLAVVALVAVNWLALRHYRRFDWTTGNIYTLSEQTNAVLRSLTRDVHVIVLMSQGDALHASTREMLERYIAVAGSKLRATYIDPDQDPVEFQHMLEQYPVHRTLTEQGQMFVEQVIIVNAGDSTRFVTPEEDFIGDDSSPMGFGTGPTFNAPKAELAMTSAIYRVVSGRQRVICLTNGHDEWSVSEGDRSLADLVDQLERFEVELRPVTVSLERVPELDECSAVVVAGPRQPFLPEESVLLERYVIEGGGDLVLLLDPIVEGGRFLPTGLESLARRLGVVVENDEAVDSELTAPFCGGGHPTAFIAVTPPPPGSTRGQPICVSRSRSVSLMTGREGDTFLETIGDGAYGEVNAAQLTSPVRDADDLAGPLVLGVALVQDNAEARTARIERERAEVEAELSEEDRRGSMVIVVGDSDFLSGDLRQHAQLRNHELSLGLFNTVADNQVLVAQPPRDMEQLQLTLTDSQLAMTFIIFILGLPLIGVAAGVSMWWTRRQ